MTKDFNLGDEQYICDNCGNTSPVANDHCPNCGGPMSALHDEKPKAQVAAGESDEDLADDESMEITDGTDSRETSLDALADEEQEESDREYKSDSFGDE